MKTAIYIPSHKREEQCRKLVNQIRSIDNKIPIYIFINEGQKYNIEDCIVVYIDKNSRVGRVRYECTIHAKENNYTHILMLDDDVSVGKNVLDLFKNFENNKELFSCAAMYKNDFFFSYKINSGLRYVLSQGVLCWVFDVDKCIELGNFDKNLIFFEDQDLQLRAMKYGYYKAVDTSVLFDVKLEGGDKNKKNGGCSSYNYFEDNKKTIEYLLLKYNNNIYFRRKKSGIFQIDYNKMYKHNIFSKLDFTKKEFDYKIWNNTSKRKSLFED